MPKQLRVKLDPVPLPEAGVRLGVEGVQVRLLQRGSGLTSGSVDSSQPAELKFSAKALTKANEGESEDLGELETLSGTLRLPAGGAPEFEVDVSAPAPDDAAETVGIGPRELVIELDPSSFKLVGGSGAALSLELPEVVKDFEHLELEATLTVAGQEEAAADINDKLDVPLRPRPLFQLRLVDHVGQPLDGVKLEFSWAGKVEVLTTDAGGFAGVDRLGARAARVEFVDPDALKERLKGIWAEPKEGAIVREAPGVFVLEATQLDDPGLMLTEQRQVVSLHPRVVQVRMNGLLFETNKNFLLPEAIPSLKRIKGLYDENPASKLLIVGHTDTAGSTSTNDSLSLERAQSMAAYLKDDVDAWLARFDSSVSETRRWGSREDLLMMTALNTPGASVGALGEELVESFQNAHNNLPAARQSARFATLPTNGVLDKQTREQLIADYMNQDETTLPDDIEIVSHGCGEHFPLSAGGDRVDSEAEDGEDDPVDRRVELFFFDEEFDVLPKPPGNNSGKDGKQYPEWRRRARATEDLDANGHGPLTLGVLNPDDGEVELHVREPDAEEPLIVLTKDQATIEETNLTFDFVAETMPSAVQFALFRNQTLEQLSTTIDPLVMRDALRVGDLGKASDQLTTKSNDSVSTAPTLAKQGASTTVGITKQALRVVVSWKHEFGKKQVNRFLRRMKVTLEDGGGTPIKEAKGSVKGKLLFDVPDKVNDVTLKCSIKAPRTGKQVLKIEEKYTVSRNPTFQTTLIPKSSTQNLRITRFEFKAGPPTVSAVGIDLDLVFLDVTEHVKALPKNVPPGEVSGRFSDVTGLKSKIVVLEYTLGRPTTWPVIIPPAFTQDTHEINTLLFLKNEANDRSDSNGVVDNSGTHTNSDDVNYTRALSSYFESPTNVARYVNPFGNDQYFNYPTMGWDKQLVDSKKSVLVLFPVPHFARYGVLNNPSKSLLESALRALAAEKHIARNQKAVPPQPPAIKRLAAGGWSSGANPLFKWGDPGNAATKVVDELYIFDGLDARQGIPIDAATWLKVKADRRLRVIGTAYTEVAANEIKRKLQLATVPNPNVFVHPGDPEFWYKDANYHRALQLSTDSAPLRFKSSAPGTASPPADATKITGLLLESQTRKLILNGTAVKSTLTLTSKFGTRSIASIAHEEAAMLASLGDAVTFGVTLPVADGPNFQRLTNQLDRIDGISEPTTCFRHRHSWSVFGGLFNNKGRPFVGFFQLCLEESGF